MRRVVAAAGWVLIGLIVAGLSLQILLALLNHQPFYGVNYEGLLLGTYSTLAALIIAGGIGIVRLVQLIREPRQHKHK